MPSAAKMSAWSHPLDQHLAQALPVNVANRNGQILALMNWAPVVAWFV